MGFIKNLKTHDFDEITMVDFSAFDKFLVLYKVYLENKKEYDFFVKEAESYLPDVSEKDITFQINLKILEKSTQKLGVILSHNKTSENVVSDEILSLKKIYKNLKKYQNALNCVGLNVDDSLSKFVDVKSFDEIEKDVRNSNKESDECCIIQKINDAYRIQKEVADKKIFDLYNELVFIRKLMDVINEYNYKLNHSNIFNYFFVKGKFRKSLKQELSDSNIFSDISFNSKNLECLVASKIKNYFKYLDAVSKFNSNYFDAISSLDNEQDVIECEPNTFVITKSDYDVDKRKMVMLYDLYKKFGVDESFFEKYSDIFNLSYNEALAKLNFCEDFCNKNYSSSAYGTYFQIEILLMTNMEFHAKFNINISDLIKYYQNNDKNELNLISTKNYKKAM